MLADNGADVCRKVVVIGMKVDWLTWGGGERDAIGTGSI